LLTLYSFLRSSPNQACANACAAGDTCKGDGNVVAGFWTATDLGISDTCDTCVKTAAADTAKLTACAATGGECADQILKPPSLDSLTSECQVGSLTSAFVQSSLVFAFKYLTTDSSFLYVQ
jgi:hypothetical protein